jgi:hypothetical protein
MSSQSEILEIQPFPVLLRLQRLASTMSGIQGTFVEAVMRLPINTSGVGAETSSLFQHSMHSTQLVPLMRWIASLSSANVLSPDELKRCARDFKRAFELILCLAPRAAATSSCGRGGPLPVQLRRSPAPRVTAAVAQEATPSRRSQKNASASSKR